MSRTVFLSSRRKGASERPECSEESSDEEARVRSYPASVADREAMDALGRICDPTLGPRELERAAEKLRIASVVTKRL